MAIRYSEPASKPVGANRANTEKPSRKGIGGRPRKPEALEAVTLRLHPDLIAKFQASGPNWRALMVSVLDAAKL